MEYPQCCCEAKHPQCEMAKDAIGKASRPEEQCTHPGNHRHWAWPEIPICCWHSDELNRMTRLMDQQAIENALQQARQTWEARSLGLKAMGTPVDH